MNQREGSSYPFQSSTILKGTKKERLKKKRDENKRKKVNNKEHPDTYIPDSS